MSSGRLSMSVAAVLFCVGAVSAQSTMQQPTSRADDQKTAGTAQTLSVTGCVQKESDVLKHNAAAANAPGMGDEFVLTRASLKPKDATAGEPAAETPPPSSNADAPGNFGRVYRVTGSRESELKSYLGQRVEITGMFKNPEDATRELGATGTAGRAPSGELTEANTPEITISAIAPSTGTCPASK